MSGLRWYLVSSALFLLPGGIQLVLFPWLVVVALDEPPWRLGLAQAITQAPMLLLVLGGVLGDRFDQRRLLVCLHGLMAVPPLFLAAAVGAGQLSFTVLVATVLLATICVALAQPIRDALLNRVAVGGIQRGVALAFGVQIGAQVVGFALGATADQVGALPLLLAWSVCMAGGALATLLIPVDSSRPVVATGDRMGGLGHTIRTTLTHPVLAPAVLMTLAVGVFFAGTFMVAVPVIVHDLHGGGAGSMGIAFAVTLLGAVVLVGGQMLRGGFGRPGRALLISGVLSALAVIAVGQSAASTIGLHLCLALWGGLGGVTVTMARAIVQEHAPATHRARVLALYSLALLGGLPVGALLMGMVVEQFGPGQAMWVPGLGMLLAAVLVAITTGLWNLRRADHEPAAQTGVAI